MTEEKLRSCPFCGKRVAFTYPWLIYFDGNKSWSFNHCCEADDGEMNICISLTAETKEKIINLWNGKAN